MLRARWWEDGPVVLADAELVAGWRAGDVSCAALLFSRHRAGMHAVAVSLLGPGSDVDDAVQDAVLIALSRSAALRDPASVGAWLRGITRNVCRRRLGHMGSAPFVAADREVDGGLGPEASIDGLATRDWVWSALDTLSAPLRHAIVLRYFTEASSYESIAAALGVPVGTIRSRLSEARRILTASLRSLANSTHDDHARAQRHRVALFSAIYDEYNRGRDCSTLRAALLADAELRAADGAWPVVRGRERIVRDIETDVEAGVRLRILDIIAGPDITVLEGAFGNPVDDPDHCPPMTTQVFLHRDSAIGTVAVHYRAGAPDGGLERAGL
jgi:RNA polymerase sigma factor (sigma-70 family)